MTYNRQLKRGLTALIMTSQPSYGSDPCASVLCLAGLVQQQSVGPACRAPLNAYFSIARFHLGGFDGNRTAAARLAFLKRCSEAPLDWIEKIQMIYGTRY